MALRDMGCRTVPLQIWVGCQKTGVCLRRLRWVGFELHLQGAGGRGVCGLVHPGVRRCSPFEGAGGGDAIKADAGWYFQVAAQV